MPQRFLRPGLTNSERWNAVPFPTQSFFIRILTLVDDFGQYDARPAVLWGQCFQIWNTSNLNQQVELQQVAQMLQQLAASRLIELYQGDDGKQFLQVTQWKERIREGCKRKYPNPEKLQQVAASCSVLLPPPPPSPPSPTSTPASPPSPSVPVQKVVVTPPPPRTKPLTPDSLSFLRETLNREYRRPETSRWSCAEEGLLAEIARRDCCKRELEEIMQFRSKMPAEDLKFFPHSVSGLLEKWDRTLDKARNYVPVRGKKSIHEQDADRLKRELDKI